jgi:hypothetical protein
MTMPNDLVGTYSLQDIADARTDLERLRRDCHEAFITRAGDSVFLYVKRVPTRHDQHAFADYLTELCADDPESEI